MSALLLSSLFSFGQGLLVRLLSKEALKVLFVKTVDMVVKSTDTKHDDEIWQEIAPILKKFDE